MPFSPQNRRLTILSIVTVCLLFVACALLLFSSNSTKTDRILNVIVVILGFAGLWWKSEWEGRKTRHDVRDPMNTVSLNAQDASKKAEAAINVTVEAFEKLQGELEGIKKSLNGELDARIVKTVDAALDAALEKRMDSLATKIADKLTAPTARVQT